jgi:hypothetical protein
LTKIDDYYNIENHFRSLKIIIKMKENNETQVLIVGDSLQFIDNSERVAEQFIVFMKARKTTSPEEALSLLNGADFSLVILSENICQKILVSLTSKDIRKTIVISDNEDFRKKCEDQLIAAMSTDVFEKKLDTFLRDKGII